jgi:hypothetical protein
LPLHFQAQVTRAHVAESTRGIFWRQARQPKVLAVLAALLLLAQVLISALFRHNQDGNLLVRGMLTLLMLLSILGVAELAARYYVGLAQANFKRIVEAPVSVRLDEDAYRFEAPWGAGTLPWSLFQSLWLFEHSWVLLQHAEDGASVVLPAAALDDEARAFLLRKLADVNGELR